MIRGFEKSLRPFIKRVIVEDGFQNLPNNRTQYSEYYNSTVKDSEHSINLTIDFCIKKKISRISDATFSSIASTLNSYALQLQLINNKDELNKFITSSINEKIAYLNRFKDKDHGFLEGKKMSFSSNEVANYLSTISDEVVNYLSAVDGTPDKSKREINVPLSATRNYSKGLNEKSKNPNFLACIYFFTIDDNVIVDSSIGVEIIFSDSTIVNSSGYFVIGNQYAFNGIQQPLNKVDIARNKRFINPATGESLNPNVKIDRDTQVNYLFGAPGDIWSGPIHIHRIADVNNPNFGKGRIMAGERHNSNIPHPYLRYIAAANNKIIDFRGSADFEDRFSYKSSVDPSLSKMDRVIYTQQKNINLKIDELISNKSIFSSCKFSIRPITRQRGNQGTKTKDNIILFFGLDKRKLLKQTTKMPTLLNALLQVNPTLYSSFINNLEIVHFELKRINERNGQADVLLIGNNDTSFNDYKSVNQLGKNISKGFSLTNKTNQIYLENGTAGEQISLYEFVDGEVDAYRENEKYRYGVKIKFRDPMIVYIENKLNNLNRAIQDLDDLLQKVSLTIEDPATGRRVKVFDEYQKQINSSFVVQSLNQDKNAVLPLRFSFDREKEIPKSIADLISIDSDMVSYFSALNIIFNNSADVIDITKFNKFMASSLMLSNTTPTLIEKNRSLLALLREKTNELLDIFSTEKITKKSTGFTRRDYLKSTRSTKSIIDGAITEYEYYFKETIDLSKTKDYFNWIEEAQPEQNTGLKTISRASYRGLVENKNITENLTDVGKNNSELTNLFDYSFLPYSSPAVLELHKTDKVNLSINHLSTLRKKLIQNTSDTPESVLIPELLATFGIKFLRPMSNLESYITDQRNYKEGEIPINNTFEDNFGSEFSSLVRKAGGSKVASFGETLSDKTAWTGGEYKDYPSNTAISILNLTTTSAFKRKNIDYLFNTRKTIPRGVRLPYSTKVFSSEVMSQQETASTIFTDVINNLFDNNGLMRFEKYSYYSYLLNIFAKVYYLKGFGQRAQEGSGVNYERFSASSAANLSFIKHMEWEPLTSAVVNGIPSGKVIICKVMLYQDPENNGLLDSDIVKMYDNYYNYNQLFLIKQGRIVLETTTDDRLIGDASAPPIEVARSSYGAETRELLNEETQAIKEAYKEEEKAEIKRDPKEDIATKKSNSSEVARKATYIKRIRT